MELAQIAWPWRGEQSPMNQLVQMAWRHSLTPPNFLISGPTWGSCQQHPLPGCRRQPTVRSSIFTLRTWRHWRSTQRVPCTRLIQSSPAGSRSEQGRLEESGVDLHSTWLDCAEVPVPVHGPVGVVLPIHVAEKLVPSCSQTEWLTTTNCSLKELIKLQSSLY